MKTRIVPPPPAEVEADDVTAPFWDALKAGRLSVPRCRTCGTFRMPPSRYCPKCRSTDIEWPALSGRGTLYSYTVSLISPRDPEAGAHVPALVAPAGAEGARLFCSIVQCEIDALRVGMDVELVPPAPGESMPMFRPVAGAGRES